MLYPRVGLAKGYDLGNKISSHFSVLSRWPGHKSHRVWQMGLHNQNSLSGLGRNQWPFHCSSLNSLQLPDPLANASTPPITQLHYGRLLLTLFYVGKVGLERWQEHPGPEIQRAVQWGRQPGGPCHIPITAQPRPGQQQRKQRLRSPSKRLPKLQDTKELEWGQLGNMRSWELNGRDRISEDQSIQSTRGCFDVSVFTETLSSVTQDISTVGWALRVPCCSWLRRGAGTGHRPPSLSTQSWWRQTRTNWATVLFCGRADSLISVFPVPHTQILYFCHRNRCSKNTCWIYYLSINEKWKRSIVNSSLGGREAENPNPAQSVPTDAGRGTGAWRGTELRLQRAEVLQATCGGVCMLLTTAWSSKRQLSTSGRGHNWVFCWEAACGWREQGQAVLPCWRINYGERIFVHSYSDLFIISLCFIFV